MRVKRLALMGLCLMGVFAVTAASAQAVSPEWWVRKTGALAPEKLPAGNETLNSQGELTVLRLNPAAKSFKCLVKGHEIVENLAVGVGEMTVFEGLCEKGSPFPCAFNEVSEFSAIQANWKSELELAGAKAFDVFTTPELEFTCLKFGAKALYIGISPFKPEVGINRLKFLGAASGELEVLGGGAPHLAFKGTYYTAPASSTYKTIRWK